MEIVLRKATQKDREQTIWVESQSTPNLSYVPHVWDMFINDTEGDWSVESVDGELAGCGKYSILPDGSAWLETLRVIPQRQGLGLGKRLYEHWLRLSEEKGVTAMRMYTGINNAVSSGLAERYGLSTVETFHGVKMEQKPFKTTHSFRPVTDVEEATALLLPLGEKWGNWIVLNRTYYKWGPEMCKWLTEKGMVYKDDEGNVVVMGARFMAEYQLHIGLFHGDAETCLGFAKANASNIGVKTIHCLYPQRFNEIEKRLLDNEFVMEPAPFIVKEINL
jgi:GNAT superfamily N-acetyltransferase